MNPWSVALRKTALVSGVFSVVVLVGLVATAIYAGSADPVPPTRIDGLVARLDQDRKNEDLKRDIRRQDVWLRQSYLRSERFATLGFLLLLGGVSSWLLCLKAANRMDANAPEPEPDAAARRAAQNRRAQFGVLATGAVLGGGVLLLTVLARHDAINAYVLNSRLPSPDYRGAKPVGGAASETEGQPLAVLSPGGSIPTLGQSTAIQGNIPVAPLPGPGGTTIQPLPTGDPGPAKPSPTAGGSAITAKIEPMSTESSSWPSFRGAGGGVATGAFPDIWKGRSVATVWKADVPLPGWGSPVLWGGRVFLSGADAKQREVYAFDAKTGSLVGRTPVPILNAKFKASEDAGFAPATVAADAKHIVATFVNGDVAGFDHAGKRLWSRTFGPLENEYGYASCPILVGGKAILQIDQGTSPEDGRSKLVALNPSTGKTVWEVKRPVSSAWSSPIAAAVSGKPVLIVCGNPLVIAYDLATGKEIWRAEGMAGEVAASATFGDGCVFVAQSGGQAMALRASDGKQVWANYELALPDAPSPSYANGLLFFASGDGTLTALDAKTGKIVWEEPTGKPVRSSPLIADGKLLLFGSDGVGRLFEASRTFKALGTTDLGEKVWASPALVEGRLYVRTEKRLICLGAK